MARLFASAGWRRGSALRSVRRAWQVLERENAPPILLVTAALLLVGSAVVYLAEQQGPEPLITTYGESLWYGVVTMATVGYGDYTPRTLLGRATGVVMMLGGMVLLTLFTATVASALVAQRIKEGRGLDSVRSRDHILLCGWNERAERVLEGLLAATRDRAQVVLVNELTEAAMHEVLFRFERAGLRYIHGDPANESVLRRASVRQARAAIVVADTSRGYGTASDERTTLVTLALKSLKPEIKVTAEALDSRSEPHLRRAGADDIVISGEFNGFLLSSGALAPGLSQVARQLLSRSGSELRREPIPPELVGKTFGELFHALRARSGFLTLAIVTEAKGLTLDDLLTDDYSLIDQFIKQQFSAAGAEYLRFEAGGTRVIVNPEDSYVVGPDDQAIGVPRRA